LGVGRFFVVALAAAGLALGVAERALACGEKVAEPPRWIDFADGTVTWREQLFGRKNVTVAIGAGNAAAGLRRRGARTIFWEMNLYRLVGTPKKPRSKAHVHRAARDLVLRARRSTGEERPWIALNELLRPRAPRPFTRAERRYRENVLLLLTKTCAQGALPWLLVPSNPRADRKSLLWWRRVGQVSGVVRQVYFSAPHVVARGPTGGALALRAKMRGSLYSLAELGIPKDRQGLMLGFQSGGVYGRNGLATRALWLRFIALKTAAARQVAREHGIATVWSWGWGTFNARGADPDKPLAACVYLWVRAKGFCPAPRRAGGALGPVVRYLYDPLPQNLRCFLNNRQTHWGLMERSRSLAGDSAVIANALASEAAIRRAFPLTKRSIAARERTLLSRGGRENVLVRLRPTMSRGLYLLVYADTLRREHARAAWGGAYERRLTTATRAHLRWLGCPSVLAVKPVSLLTLAERRLR
jgi:hypothetical protein